MSYRSLSILVALVIAGTPVAVLAHDADLEAELEKIESKVTTLISPKVELFNTDLTLGASGVTVTRLQEFLIAGGHTIPAGVTGYFGAQTQAALAAFQTKHGIAPAAGYFGPLTRTKVNEVLTASVIESEGEEKHDHEEEEEHEEDKEEAKAESTTDGEKVRSKSVSTLVEGANNDYATFTIEIEVESFGEDAYVPTDATAAFTYQIENAATGAVVAGATKKVVTLASSADESGNYYILREDDDEDFTLTVTFDPLPADEGATYRLQLLTLEFANAKQAPNRSWNASPGNDYETPGAYIND